MSYIEDAIYSFVRGIFTRGIIVLTNKRFITYTLFSLILISLLSIYSFIKGGNEVTNTYLFLNNLELAVCVSLIVTGLISLKIQMIKVEHAFFFIITGILFILSFFEPDITNLIENFFVMISFYSWIITTNIAGLMAIREFIISWPGWIIRLGDKDDQLMFSPVIKLILFGTIVWFIYSLFTSFSWILVLAFAAAAVVLYTIYIFIPVTGDGIMASIISFQYIGLLYHLFVRAESSTGFLFFDILIIASSTIFTAQGISNLIASKKHAMPYQWDSLIILLLGFMLGYHLLSVKITMSIGLRGLYSLYHNISFGFGTLILYAVLVLYTSKSGFRDFSKQRITVGYAARKLSGLGLEAVTNYVKKVKENLKTSGWSFELRKDDNEGGKTDDKVF